MPAAPSARGKGSGDPTDVILYLLHGVAYMRVRHGVQTDLHEPARPDRDGPVGPLRSCIASPPPCLLGLLASAGGLLGKPIIHEVGLTLAMVLGASRSAAASASMASCCRARSASLGLGVMACAMSLPETRLRARLYRRSASPILALGHRLNMMASTPTSDSLPRHAAEVYLISVTTWPATIISFTKAIRSSTRRATG